jgi:hypothetical protein
MISLGERIKQLGMGCPCKFYSEDRSRHGFLIPLDDYLYSREGIINNIVLWRNRDTQAISNYTKVTFHETAAYLKKWINCSDRVFFLIFSADNEIIGHIGVIISGPESASLENFRRGVSTPDFPDMFFRAELFLINLFESKFNITRIDIETMSYNIPLIAMHEAAGFRVKQCVEFDSGEIKVWKGGRLMQDAHKKFKRVKMLRLSAG